MKKIHTRIKRKKGLSSTHRHSAFLRSSARKKGDKTFITEEKAKKFMAEKKLSTKEYKIVKVKKGKKFGIKKIL